MVSQTVAPGAAFTSLSSNDAIQFLLADIPIFTVGILAFGTMMFFFLMKRVDRWVFCLHISVLLSFLAALLDLSQLLIRGHEQAVPGADPEAGVKGLIQAREVFYSFANALRFLFYWGFVAMIPLGETIPEGNIMHSGSWRRWGIIGAILKWTSLTIVLVMSILQLTYRNAPSLQRIGPVYEAEATLEIILSAVFILKLLLNTWARYPTGTMTQSKGKMLVQYAPMIVALLFSLWIGVGNAILFEFTETALGRFMRAIELYIVIVYMLTISFHHLRHLSFFPIYRPATKGPSRANTFNRNSMEKSDEIYATKGVAAPQQVNNFMEVLEEQYRTAQTVPLTVERNSARSATVQNANQHQSMAVRLSTWLGVARPLPRPPNPHTLQSWDVDTERGPSPVALTTVEPWYAEEKPHLQNLAIPAESVIDEDEQRGVSPLPDFPLRALPERRSPSPVSSVLSIKEVPAALTVERADVESERSPVPSRDWQDLEYSNAARYSGVTEDVLANSLRQNHYLQQDESPIGENIQVVSPPSEDDASRPSSMNSVKSTGGYLASPYPASPYPSSPIGSAAVTPLPRSRPLPPMPVAQVSMLPSPMSPMHPDSARSSNMSILLRQQNELDQSIEALKKFSPSKQVFDENGVPDTQTIYYAEYEQEDLQQSARLSSAPSAPSPDLTLSTPRADMIQSSAQSEFPVKHLPPLNRSSMDSNVIPPTLPIRGEMKAFPSPSLAPPRMPISRFSDSSSVVERRERKGTDSMGTQYDITSFVGNLTVPVNPKDSVMSSSSGKFSEDGVVGIATVARPGFAQFARPTLITNVARQEDSTSAQSASPIRRALPVPPSAAQAPMQSPQSQPSASPIRFRRAVGLPARPRLSVMNLTPVSEKTTSPSDTATLTTSPPTGSGTPLTGKAW